MGRRRTELGVEVRSDVGPGRSVPGADRRPTGGQTQRVSSRGPEAGPRPRRVAGPRAARPGPGSGPAEACAPNAGLPGPAPRPPACPAAPATLTTQRAGGERGHTENPTRRPVPPTAVALGGLRRVPCKPRGPYAFESDSPARPVPPNHAPTPAGAPELTPPKGCTAGP